MHDTLHYITFKDDTELTQFQNDNAIGIISILPFAQSIKMDCDNTEDMNGKISTGVFVVYFYR